MLCFLINMFKKIKTKENAYKKGTLVAIIYYEEYCANVV